jgi:hypothetical protein
MADPTGASCPPPSADDMHLAFLLILPVFAPELLCELLCKAITPPLR